MEGKRRGTTRACVPVGRTFRPASASTTTAAAAPQHRLHHVAVSSNGHTPFRRVAHVVALWLVHVSSKQRTQDVQKREKWSGLPERGVANPQRSVAAPNRRGACLRSLQTPARRLAWWVRADGGSDTPRGRPFAMARSCALITYNIMRFFVVVALIFVAVATVLILIDSFAVNKVRRTPGRRRSGGKGTQRVACSRRRHGRQRGAAGEGHKTHVVCGGVPG